MWDLEMVILSSQFSHPSNGHENFHQGHRGVPTSTPATQPLNLSDAQFSAGRRSGESSFALQLLYHALITFR